MKLRYHIQFPFTLTREVVKDLKIVTESLTLLCEGIGYVPKDELFDIEGYDFDLEAVSYNGFDVRELLEFLSVTDDIHGEACNEIYRVILSHKEVAA